MGRPRKVSRERVLDAINGWLIEHGIPPSVEELRRSLGVGSKQTVLRYLRGLEDSGDIERRSGTARGLKVVGMGARKENTRLVPVVGTAPAGPLMLAEENLEGWVQVPRTMAPSGARYFLLRVRGDSMNRARVASENIESGDLVLVRQQVTADPGNIVVAILDGEATIKRLVAGRGYWVLKPESSNPAHRPIVVDRDFRIQGAVTRVFKKGSSIIG